MENTIKEVEERIAEYRKIIAEYREKVEEVENAKRYDHEYWQGLTDELWLYEDDLKKELRLLKALKRNFRQLEKLRKLSREDE